MTGLGEMQTAIDTALNGHLPESSELAPRLVEAMRYAVLGGGKHIRPLLTCATATSLGAPLDHALMPGCAVTLTSPTQVPSTRFPKTLKPPVFIRLVKPLPVLMFPLQPTESLPPAA